MEFLRAVPAMELTDEGSRYSTFFAEVLETRPGREEIRGSQQLALEIEEAFDEALQISACIRSVFFYIDAAGMFMVATFERQVSTSHAKTHTHSIVRSLPQMHRRVIEKTLRACDELDKDRITAMTTVQACRPSGVGQHCKTHQTRAPLNTLADLLAAGDFCFYS